jgi:hypothetical protein
MAGSPVSLVTPDSGDMRSLVLRAWLQPGVLPHLRVRVVEITPGRSEQPIIVTTSVDDACRAVRNWLAAFQLPDTNGNGDGGVARKG